jgi:putative oxygen-independent coproporphyrinogen III oxidase
MGPAIDANNASDTAPFLGESGRLGVYVHFPWCLQKCPYCDFLSVAAPREAIPHAPYAEAVLSELARRQQDIGGHLSSVFFGGGTPSLWNPLELGRVIQAIRGAFSSGDEPEITVECNPSSFDEDRGRALVDVGVNRVSIGVQSLDRGRLEFLGRLHDVDGGLRAVEAALAAGVPRVSADLIFGVAGQSTEDAVREASAVADLGVTHLSAYALTIEPGTRFGALSRKGLLPLLADDIVAESFVALHETLTARGFAHYEVSNYGMPGHFARHNLGYWHGDDYLGLGCGAWGTVTLGNNRVRYRNTPVPDRYVGSALEWPRADLTRAGAGELVSELEVLSPSALLMERLMLGLRLSEGVDVEAAARRLGVDPWPAERLRSVERLASRGRVVREGPRLRIPHDAWLLADGTIAEIV